MNLKEKLIYLYTYSKELRIPQSTLKAIPIIGGSLEELIYGGEVEDFISIISKQSDENQNTIINKLEILIEEKENKKPFIVTVGGGNSENILKIEEDVDFEIGEKHKVETEELFGGSAVNHTMRLLSYGCDVFPILSIGNDSIGKNIKENIIKSINKTSKSKRILEFIGNKNDIGFYEPNIITPSTTIIVEKKARTILTQKIKHGEFFSRYVESRLNKIDKSINATPKAVMIGHIHSDSRAISKGNAGEISKYIIEHFKNKCIVFANFGSSQLSLGLDFWAEYLPYIDIFQVNISEARKFFLGDKGEKLKLTEIIRKIRELNINVIITLDKLGAIGIHKNSKSAVYIVWPVLDSKDVIDPTGAGDAFAAGLVQHLINEKNLTSSVFIEALADARLWAAYACGTYGGANKCPSKDSLLSYKKSINVTDSDEAVERRGKRSSAEFLTIFDRVFQ